MKCRSCSTELIHTFLDLGFAPPSNAYLSEEQLVRPEKYYPLRLRVCDSCWLVQTEDYADADELFSPDYAYFSSTSSSWLAHAAKYTEAVSRKYQLTDSSLVVEVASNDGYLLKNFVAAGVPCLGIEPTAGTASAAEALGVPVMREFFGEDLATQLSLAGQQADLIVGNNVYAHVPDINDFTRGLKVLLKPGGTITLEFPHLLQLIAQSQFDTVYHEHFSYLSLFTVAHIFRRAGLRLTDVERLSTHGGSLRVYGCHDDDERGDSPAVAQLLAEEADFGLQQMNVYDAFQSKADSVKNELLEFLLEQKREGRTVSAYGAAAKGNTLLNYAGVKPDLVRFVCDAAPSKQGKYMPGSHLPIVPPSKMFEQVPDFVLILPWNIADEVKQQNQQLATSGARFVTAVPELKVQ